MESSTTNMDFSRPRQRLTRGQKDTKWKTDCLKYFCSQADRFWREEYQRMYANYRFYHNIIDQGEFKRWCDPMNLDKQGTQSFVHAFNKAPTKINVLVGEEKDRPWRYHVISPSPNTTNEVIRNQTRELREWMEQKLSIELQQQQKLREVKAGLSEDLSPEEAQVILEQISQQLQEEEAELQDPAKIKLKYKNAKTLTEQLMAKLVKIAELEQNLKHKKAESFLDYNIAGLDPILVNVVNNRLNVEVVNPLGIAYHKSPEVEFIQEGDWVAIKKEMSTADILDIYGKYLSEEEVKELEMHLSQSYGFNDKFASPTGESSSHWRQVSLRNGDSSSLVLHEGLYGQSVSQEYFHPVCEVYWRSQKKEGLLMMTDPTGETTTTRVDEAFPVPKNAETIRFKDTDDIQVTNYIWSDEGVEYTLEWQWVPEIWTGARIKTNIFINTRPYKYALTNAEDPYDVLLPVFGTAAGARNAPIVSTMDRAMPWAKLYMFFFTKVLKLVMQDRGQLVGLNTLMIDPTIGFEKSMQYMFDMGFIPYNPLANAETAGSYLSSMNFMKAENASNSQQVAHYIDILRFVEDNLGDAIGVPKVREGQTGANTAVTNNQQDLVQQNKVTRILFAKHDLVWEGVLNGIVRTIQNLYNDGKMHYIRYMLSDEEIATLELKPDVFKNIALGCKIVDSAQIQQVLDITKQNIQALLQNDKIQLSTLITLLSTEDLAEIKSEVEKMEGNIQAMQQQQAEMQGAKAAETLQQNLGIQHQFTMDQKQFERDTQVILQDKKDAAAIKLQQMEDTTDLAIANQDSTTKTQTTEKTAEATKEASSTKAATDIYKAHVQAATTIAAAKLKPKPKATKKK